MTQPQTGKFSVSYYNKPESPQAGIVYAPTDTELAESSVFEKPKLLSHLVSAYLIESGYFDVQHFAQTAIKITAYYHTIHETYVV